MEAHRRARYIDMDLLISISNGLGAFNMEANDRKVYVKDADCLGGSSGQRGSCSATGCRYLQFFLRNSCLLPAPLRCWLPQQAV